MNGPLKPSHAIILNCERVEALGKTIRAFITANGHLRKCRISLLTYSTAMDGLNVISFPDRNEVIIIVNDGYY